VFHSFYIITCWPKYEYIVRPYRMFVHHMSQTKHRGTQTMKTQFTVHIDSWAHGAAIPAQFAFGRPGTDSPFAPSDNISPAIRWSDAPAGTRSFAIICHDPDVPSSGEDVNQQGKMVPADLPRVNFFHWVLVNISAEVSGPGRGCSQSGHHAARQISRSNPTRRDRQERLHGMVRG